MSILGKTWKFVAWIVSFLLIFLTSGPHEQLQVIHMLHFLLPLTICAAIDIYEV